MPNQPIVKVRNLTKKFRLGRGVFLHAVDNLSFEINETEILGLVGESGCGKSTLGRLIIKLLEPTSGHIDFSGTDVSHKLTLRERRNFSRDVQLIFQDPYSSLNPRMTVKDIIAEGPDSCGLWNSSERESKVTFWLERVGLHASHASRYPHEFSGGQRQRIGIARALALEPKLVICDEPISALDVSVQAQIVNLLKELQSERKLTYLFIAHDLSMVRVICDRMAVMYLGKIIELGSSAQVYDNPQHPYTKALVSSNPVPDPEFEQRRTRALIQGEISSPVNPKPGCRFAPRCPHVMDICQTIDPPDIKTDSGQVVACHLFSLKQ